MNYLRQLLALIAAFLTLGPDPDPDPAAAAGGGAEDPPGDGLEDLDLEGDPPDDPDPAGGGDGHADDPDAVHQRALTAERTRADTAERNARESAERLAQLERQQRAPPATVNQDQQQFEQEEARLRASDCSPQEKWQIESNRVLRATQRDAQQAVFNSREMADKAEFTTLCNSKPLAKKYAERVEVKLAEMRKQGFNIERKLVLKMIIGDDIVEGKVKTTKKAPAAGSAEGQQRQPVARGKPAAGRSDVSGRGANSEQEKRRQRLANQLI